MMFQPLTDPDVLKSVLAKHGIRTARSLGQNFLICEEVVQSVLVALEGGSNQVTELGPGVGTLTQGLIAHGYHVRAIEKDDEFVNILPGMMPANLRKNLTIIHGDLKDEEWLAFVPPAGDTTATNNGYAIVGNIPYNLSGFIIRRLTKLQTPPSKAIFLVQKEVADRILMRDNAMSLLSLSIALWGHAELLLRVPPSCFIPQPSVHSALIMLTPSPNQPPVAVREKIIATAKPFFQAKRKQIGHTLKTNFAKSQDDVREIEQRINISATARPENLSVSDWAALCDIL